MAAPEVRDTIDAIFRIEWARLVAGLTRLVRDVGVAEELAQDALLSALEQWPHEGVPEKPGAWLMSAAKRRGINVIRRSKMMESKHVEVGQDLEERQAEAPLAIESAAADDVGDDLLRLIFIACHPVLSREARAALTLRLLGGLSTEEIARAFLVPEPTMAQRIVRAKHTLAEAKVAYEMPRGQELADRLSSVFEVVYLIFNEGYAATAGDVWTRPALCDEALRLGRALAAIAPAEPEAHGLLALMELHASRLRARVGPDGEPILLLDQDRARWDQVLIQRGLFALRHAEELGGEGGWYALQAAISACHARAATAGHTNWPQIAELYARLGRLRPAPILELNRAVAVGMAFGPAAGLELVDALRAEPSLRDYPLLASARADLLEKLGQLEEARKEYERAAALTRNARDREVLLARARAVATRA
jgi:RNA polymerase sigma factor (sigma-70 family)